MRVIFILFCAILFMIVFFKPSGTSAAQSAKKPNPTILHNVSSVGRTFNYSAGAWSFDFNNTTGIAYARNDTASANSLQWIIDCRQDITPVGVNCWNGANPTGNITAAPGEIIAVRVGSKCYAYQIDLHDTGGILWLCR